MRSFFVIFFLLVNSSYIIAQDCQLSLSGHVEDADTHEKLQGATVQLVETNRLVTTDAKGDFIFDTVCPGIYHILLTHSDCDSLLTEINLSKTEHLDLHLPHIRKLMGDVIIDVHKGVSNTGFRKELQGFRLEQTRGLSLGESLSRLNGVSMLQTGNNISKPVIHGLHGNRLLTINNGVRQEGQQWGNEHAPEIDPFIADRLTVIKGVDELRYGTDAIGGVILVEPKALRNSPGYHGEVNYIFSHNNGQHVASLLWEEALQKKPAFRYRIQGSAKIGGNIRTPHYRLNNTGNRELNYSITAAWKKEQFSSEIFYSHFSGKIGIFTGSHIGNLTDLTNAIEISSPSSVFLGEKTYSIQRPSQEIAHDLIKSKSQFLFQEHRFTVQLAGQINRRKEFDILRNRENTKPQMDLSIQTISEEFTWEHPKKNGFTGMGGLVMQQQQNRYVGRYFIPNYTSTAYGIFYLEKWNNKNWECQAGLRYDDKQLQTQRLRWNSNEINHNFRFNTAAASLHLLYQSNEHFKWNTGVSLSSRAPHVNELLSDGIHHGTATYEKGDIQLKPERSVHFSIGLDWQDHLQKMALEVLIYSNRIHNFIYLQPRPEQPVLTIAGAFPLMQYMQTDALLQGSDISFRISPFTRWETSVKCSFLQARNLATNDWLVWMPANRFSQEVIYRFRDRKKIKHAYISTEVSHVMRQYNTPDESKGKQDYKAPPPAYTRVDMQASLTISVCSKPLVVSLGIRNLLDTVYRDYLNTMRYFMDEMGRNISIRWKYSL